MVGVETRFIFWIKISSFPSAFSFYGFYRLNVFDISFPKQRIKHILLKFIITIFITSLVLLFIPHIAVEQNWIKASPSYGVEIISALALITTAVFYLLQRIQKADPVKFVESYLLSVVFKMGVGCAIILTVILIDRQGAMANALLFIVTYFSMTGLEIFFLLTEKRRG